jgi:tetratricopeptide (TPR) repeat protein
MTLGDSVSYANSVYQLSGFHRELGDYQTAEELITKAISIFERHESTYYLIYAYSGLGDIYNQQDKLSLSIEFNNRAYTLAKASNLKDMQGVSLGNIGSVYLKLESGQEAVSYLERAVLILEEIESNDLLLECYRELSLAFSLVGDDKKALDIFTKYHNSDKQIYNIAKSNTIAELHTKYETEKKESEIASLSQQASIQSLQIKQKNQATLIGVIVLLLAFSIIYFIYRHRSLKKQQSHTELEQRFLRSQLNPHFISNALMAVQNFMLKNQTEKAALYLAKFSKLMREILENSRQEFILVEDELQMLTNFMDIHKVRMNDAFDYKINIDENIDPETDTIPPMFVQPFIENAIEHGIINAKDKGFIELNFIKEGEYISISVTDNGEGMIQSPGKSEEHTSLSTTIIRERMDLFNKSLKNKIELLLGDYKNDQGEIQGTKVELKVPFSYL